MDSLSEIASACSSEVATDKGESSQRPSREVFGVLTDRVAINRQGALLDPVKARQTTEEFWEKVCEKYCWNTALQNHWSIEKTYEEFYTPMHEPFLKAVPELLIRYMKTDPWKRDEERRRKPSNTMG
jgi:hypothetical protein